jgi:hypothetical protein
LGYMRSPARSSGVAGAAAGVVIREAIERG